MTSQQTAPSDLRPDGRSHHDMGGLFAGPIDRSEHDHAMWEKRVDALMVVLSSPRHGLLKVDELRRHIEGLGTGAYDAMSYYERSMAAISAALIERGIISIEALGRKMAAIEERHPTAPEP
jgi:hypothetical protein